MDGGAVQQRSRSLQVSGRVRHQSGARQNAQNEGYGKSDRGARRPGVRELQEGDVFFVRDLGQASAGRDSRQPSPPRACFLEGAQGLLCLSRVARCDHERVLADESWERVVADYVDGNWTGVGDDRIHQVASDGRAAHAEDRHR